MNDSKQKTRTCRCGHGAVDHDRWGKGACSPWLQADSGVIYVGQCACKEADYAAGPRD